MTWGFKTSGIYEHESHGLKLLAGLECKSMREHI